MLFLGRESRACHVVTILIIKIDGSLSKTARLDSPFFPGPDRERAYVLSSAVD